MNFNEFPSLVVYRNRETLGINICVLFWLRKALVLGFSSKQFFWTKVTLLGKFIEKSLSCSKLKKKISNIFWVVSVSTRFLWRHQIKVNNPRQTFWTGPFAIHRVKREPGMYVPISYDSQLVVFDFQILLCRVVV